MESDILTNDGGKYKQSCSRLGCRNKPTKVLMVAFVQKKGRFCETCASELLMDNLVTQAGTCDKS